MRPATRPIVHQARHVGRCAAVRASITSRAVSGKDSVAVVSRWPEPTTTVAPAHRAAVTAASPGVPPRRREVAAATGATAAAAAAGSSRKSHRFPPTRSYQAVASNGTSGGWST